MNYPECIYCGDDLTNNTSMDSRDVCKSCAGENLSENRQLLNRFLAASAREREEALSAVLAAKHVREAQSC